MKIPSLVEMLQAGVHFGHQASRWHPKMKPFIFTERNGVHVIDLEKTQVELEVVLGQVKKMATEGKVILFVSTKPQAREIVRQAAIDCGMPYLVDRWIGGLLTNFSEIKKSLATYNRLKAEQLSGELEKYTKKEQLDISKKLEKMDLSFGGLVGLEKIPDVVFLPAFQREKTAVIEANKMGVEVIGVCDTNANPEKATYVIPANDDAVNAIRMITNLVSEAISAGVKEIPVVVPEKKEEKRSARPTQEIASE
jgi:small subunit ribosomal protein S2